MPQVVQHRINQAQGDVPVMRHEYPPTEKKIAESATRRALPLVAVCGGAMAATAWLPLDNPTLGFFILGAEVVLGVAAVAYLVSSNR